jgi:DHA1 family bicyclomycin/chloramphenicol resistance-like MFS transporter
LLAFFQLGVGAVISTAISAATPEDRLPIIAIFGVTATVGLIILVLGHKRAHHSTATE